MNVRHWFSVVILLLLACSPPAPGEENRARTTRICPCLPVTSPITVDGRLAPAEWGDTVEIAGFTVSGSDRPVPEPVLMRLAYDRTHLYLAVTCMESNMKGLKTGGATQHDGAFWLDDAVEFFLDTNHDHKTYLQFAATARGIRYENRQGDSAWNAGWIAAAVSGADRWTIEMAVPFADLGAPPPSAGDLWGFNLCRERQAGGHLELYNWANVERVFKSAALFGHIAFLPANWKASAATVRGPLRRAGGEEAQLFVADGLWSMRGQSVPIHTSFLEQLRIEDKTCPPFIAKLATIYAADSALPYAKHYRKLADEYTAIRKVIQGKRPLDAATFDRHAGRLKSLRTESETLFWRVKLAELNRAMR